MSHARVAKFNGDDGTVREWMFHLTKPYPWIRKNKERRRNKIARQSRKRNRHAKTG